jgi:hypothetical protein
MDVVAVDPPGRGCGCPRVERGALVFADAAFFPPVVFPVFVPLPPPRAAAAAPLLIPFRFIHRTRIATSRTPLFGRRAAMRTYRHSDSVNVGVEFKGVRSGVERRRGVSGLKPRDPGRRETHAGKKSP